MMRRIRCECGQQFAAANLSGQRRTACPFCRAPISAEVGGPEQRPRQPASPGDASHVERPTGAIARADEPPPTEGEAGGPRHCGGAGPRPASAASVAITKAVLYAVMAVMAVGPPLIVLRVALGLWLR